MDRIGKYEVTEFSKARQDITIVSQEGKRRLTIHALLEVDVTKAREMIAALKGKEDISFTGWIVKCVSQAVSEHKQMNSYRLGRKKMVSFEDVDIPIPIERNIGGVQRPLAYIIRKANEKTVAEITQEIRRMQHQEIDPSTEVLGEDLTGFERWALTAPGWLKKIGVRVLRLRGLSKKKHFGTVGVTAIGMKGSFPGWAIGMGGPIATLIIVGGITKKPGVVDDEIRIREILHITITADHAIVDGSPLVRFIARLTELLESGYEL
ncbi:MAG TPA: 2-oxo acid dehydrogenase subunit E2 [Thermoplasmata archaeon]|nr:2-oxo acid dehydrogenase subunit E2 [Thermoplasmata archaeon]HIH28223.1 2-oxo acid dehydrogenase subunit E2 [Thermoplasmata archaeon]